MTFHSLFNNLGQIRGGLVQLPLTVRPSMDCSAVELPGFEWATWSSRERFPSKSSSKLRGWLISSSVMSWRASAESTHKALVSEEKILAKGWVLLCHQLQILVLFLKFPEKTGKPLNPEFHLTMSWWDKSLLTWENQEIEINYIKWATQGSSSSIIFVKF